MVRIMAAFDARTQRLLGQIIILIDANERRETEDPHARKKHRHVRSGLAARGEVRFQQVGVYKLRGQSWETSVRSIVGFLDCR